MPTSSAIAGLRLGFAGSRGCQLAHLSVDGMTERGPNLSHWPGNRTPARWKADLSTGITLRFARAPAAEQHEFLGGVELVLNDHYDTDGFGALLAILRPDVAMAREELLLAAAATGDFGTWQTQRAFAIDRIVARIATPESPAAAAFRGAADVDELSLRRYQWLIEHAPEVLDGPQRFQPLYAEEMAQVEREIDAGLRGALDRRRWAELDFAVVTSSDACHRMTLNTLAGAHRVLHVQAAADGPHYRYHDRTESWFELLTFHPLPRRDLRPLATHLAGLEPGHDGACWNADAPTEPIPEVYFGVPSAQEYGRISRELRPSRLPVERVVAAFVAHFSRPAQP
jgi:hypothetical protein